MPLKRCHLVVSLGRSDVDLQVILAKKPLAQCEIVLSVPHALVGKKQHRKPRPTSYKTSTSVGITPNKLSSKVQVKQVLLVA